MFFDQNENNFYCELLSNWLKQSIIVCMQVLKINSIMVILHLINLGGKMTLLVLNSMYWTWSTWKPYDYFQERAMNQIKWLEEQLELAKSKGNKVLITSHIPPG